MKKILLTIALFLSLASPAFAAIGRDQHNFVTATAAVASTWTWTNAFTIAASNEYLVISCWNQNGGTLASPLFNGVAMTVINSDKWQADGFAYLFGVKNPATGAHNFSVTTGGATNGVTCNGTSFTGVDMTTPTDTTNKVASTANPITLSLTPTSANEVLYINFYDDRGNGALSAGSGFTNSFVGYASTVVLFGDTIGTTATAGALYSAVGNAGTSPLTEMMGVFLNPAAAVTATTCLWCFWNF